MNHAPELSGGEQGDRAARRALTGPGRIEASSTDRLAEPGLGTRSGSSARSAAMQLADDSPVVGAHPHAATPVSPRLLADRARVLPAPAFHPEHEAASEEHDAQDEHRIHGVHSESWSDRGATARDAAGVERTGFADPGKPAPRWDVTFFPSGRSLK
jgi:hypothetical protein